MSDNKRINRAILLGWGVVVTLITLAYTLEVFKELRTVSYFITLLILLFIPFGVCLVWFKKYPDSNRLVYACIIGYNIMYWFVLLTGNTIMTSTYSLPIMFLVLLTSNVKMVSLMMSLNFLANLVSAIMAIAATEGEVYLAQYEIQILIAAIIGVNAYLACKILNQLNSAKLEKVQHQQESSAQTIQLISDTTTVLTTESEGTLKLSGNVKEFAETQFYAMEDISKGTAEMAEGIQNQLIMVQNIAELSDECMKCGEEVENQFGNVAEMVKKSRDDLKNIADDGKSNAIICRNTSAAMDELVENVSKASETLKLIEAIQKQTNLLSFNASIEAARAGETGRGFAIVANEIKRLAEQTASSANDIRSILDSLSAKTEEVKDSMDKLVTVNESQVELLVENAQMSDKMLEAVNAAVNANKKEDQLMAEIVGSNADIKGVVENLSAFSEELATTADHSMEISINVKGKAEEISKAVQVIAEGIDTLYNHSKKD